jgi:hypothetical protein
LRKKILSLTPIRLATKKIFAARLEVWPVSPVLKDVKAWENTSNSNNPLGKLLLIEAKGYEAAKEKYSLSLVLAHHVRTFSVWTLIVIGLASIPGVSAQGSLGPNKNIEAIGVPAIPASLPLEVQPYIDIYGLPLAGWNPAKREIWLKGLSSATWVARVNSPGATPETSSIYIQSGGISDIYFQPQGKYLAYTRDENGNE